MNTEISKFIADTKLLWIVKSSTNGDQLLKDLIIVWISWQEVDKWASVWINIRHPEGKKKILTRLLQCWIWNQHLQLRKVILGAWLAFLWTLWFNVQQYFKKSSNVGQHQESSNTTQRASFCCYIKTLWAHYLHTVAALVSTLKK